MNVAERSPVTATLSRAAKIAFLLVVVAVAALLALRWAMNSTADDLERAAQGARGPARSQIVAASEGQLTAWLAGGVQGDGGPALEARSKLLDQRADRLGETAGTLALVGLLLALVTPERKRAIRGQRTGHEPAMSTSSSGSD